MKKNKKENGAIAVVTLISVIFIISFLVSSYLVVANKVQSQKEILDQTKKVYEPTSSMEEIYNSYFTNSEIVPIYTVEQLLSIGTGRGIAIPEEGGKYYKFAKDVNYVLMNDLEFKTADWTNLIGKDEAGNPKEWQPIGELLKIENDDFTGNFEGKGHKIRVTDLNGKLHECNEQNEYYYYRTLTIKIQQTSNQDFLVKVNHVIDGTEYNYGKEHLQSGGDGFLYFKENIDYGDTIDYNINVGYDTYNPVPETLVAKTGILMIKDKSIQVELTTQQIFREWAGDEKGISIPSDGIYELVLVGGGGRRMFGSSRKLL